MTGFIRGLFGGNKKNEDRAPAPRRSGDSYYLDMDSARTFGDIEKMRKEQKVKRTFPVDRITDKRFIAVKNEAAQSAPSNGAMGGMTGSSSMSNANGSAGADSLPGSVPTTDNTQRRKSDSSLDAFRKMAKDMRK